MESDLLVGHRFLDALARHDFEALEASLDAAVRFRALAPGETVATTNAAEAAACFQRWFGDKTDIEIVDRQVEVLVDRLRLDYRARVRKNGMPYVVAQSLVGDLDAGKFSSLDLVCAGFRPEPAAAAHGTTHLFDAGDLGCGTGLPREFRTRMSQIPVGHVLEIVTGDSAAREDLPSMARLLGHCVRSVELRADGKTHIQVERSQ
jgi:TusA-related sulfurtransferase